VLLAIQPPLNNSKPVVLRESQDVNYRTDALDAAKGDGRVASRL
jgi:hypothetical protein